MAAQWFIEDEMDIMMPQRGRPLSKVKSESDWFKKTLTIDWVLRGYSRVNKTDPTLTEIFQASFCSTLNWQGQLYWYKTANWVGVYLKTPSKKPQNYITSITFATLGAEDVLENVQELTGDLLKEPTPLGYGFPQFLAIPLPNNGPIGFAGNFGDGLNVAIGGGVGGMAGGGGAAGVAGAANHLLGYTTPLKIRIVVKYKPNTSDFEDPVTLTRMMAYKSLVDNETFSDFKIVLPEQDITIEVNKSILLVQWPYFNRMIVANMTEASEKKMEITGHDVEVVRSMIVYIYTGFVEIVSTAHAIDLLKIAHQYELEDLVKMSVNYVGDKLDSSNFIELLILADRYVLKNLKQICVAFLRSEKKKTTHGIKLENFAGHEEFKNYDNQLAVLRELLNDV